MSSITTKDLIETRDKLKKIYESIKDECMKKDRELIEKKLKDIEKILNQIESKSKIIDKSTEVVEDTLKIFDKYRGYDNSISDAEYDSKYNFKVLLNKQKEYDTKYKQLQKYKDIDELGKLFDEI